MGFLNDYGRHVRVSNMLRLENIKSRLNSSTGINMSEFIYPICQAIDFSYLNSKYGYNCQLGGSDQWGNMISGSNLIKKKTGEQISVMTTPLFILKNGEKMGKSSGNALWLDSCKNSLFSFYKFITELDDITALKYAPLLSFEPLENVENAIHKHLVDPKSAFLQHWLARNICSVVFSQQNAHDIEILSRKLKACDLSLTKLETDMLGLSFQKQEGQSNNWLDFLSKCFLQYDTCKNNFNYLDQIKNAINTNGIKINNRSFAEYKDLNISSFARSRIKVDVGREVVVVDVI